MNENEFIQLFWFIGFVTGVCTILVVGGLVADKLDQRDYRKYMKHLAAKKRWAEMLTPYHNREE